MNCPWCGRKLNPGEMILLDTEPVYYCTHCWRQITSHPDFLYLKKEKEARYGNLRRGLFSRIECLEQKVSGLEKKLLK